MKKLVIYHGGCWDGFCAAWLMRKAFPNAEFHSAHYGTEPPDVSWREVIIVDFSYPREVMERIGVACQGRLVVLDHHKTAEESLNGLSEAILQKTGRRPFVFFDMEQSGGRLAFNWLKRMAPISWDMSDAFLRDYELPIAPWIVDYTEDRDLWKWKLPDSREVNAALRSYPLDFATWDRICSMPTKDLVPEGRAILRYQQSIIDSHVRHANEVEIAGYNVLQVNATVMFSEIAGELSKGRPFGAAYFDRKDGKRQFSLRSDPDGIDVSEIAKKFGGGGHKHAAGFEVSPDHFEKGTPSQ